MTLEQNAAAGRRRKPRMRVKRLEALYKQGEISKARDLTRTFVLRTPLEPGQVARLLQVTSHTEPIEDADVLFKMKHDLSGQDMPDEDRRRLLPILHLGETQPDPARSYLFVSGVARSGTTALGRLLNLSQDVALFVERFAPQYGYHPLMFAPEHVFAVRKNKRQGSIWADAEQKFGTATFVGDKRPGFLQSWNITRHNFPPGRIKVLHIVRDIRGVAWSYNRRIEAAQSGSKSKWSESRDHERAVADYNLNNCALLAAVSEAVRRDDFIVVDYDRIFRSAPLAEEVFRRIGIPVTDALRHEVERFIARSEGILERERPLTPEEEDYIETHVDWEEARAVKSLCLPDAAPG